MIFIWDILQSCLLLVIIILGISQLIVPALIGWPLFWFFRKTDSELFMVNQNLSDIQTMEKINQVKDKINSFIRPGKQ